MAEAFIINGVKMILNAVVAQVESEIALAWAAEGELYKLKDKLENLQRVLHDAEKRQVKEPSVRHWLEKLKKVAYDAQDVMDDFSYEAIRQEKEVPAVPHPLMKQFIDLVLNFCSSSNPFLFQLKMAHMIRDINWNFDKIKEDMKEHSFLEQNLPLGPYYPGDADDGDDDDHWETHSTTSVNQSRIVGREAEKSMLVALLTNSTYEEQEGSSVLPILGMGGLGKTTLTQLIYNDEHIKNYFKELQMWVYVSRSFDVKKLLADIITKSNGGSSNVGTDDSNIEMLTEKLKTNLGGKRFLLVLDDVWNEDLRKWEAVRDVLDCGGKGSKIIVTTRRHEVALLVGTLETCKLKPLTCEDAWFLFRQRAFRSSARSEERQDLAEVGKRIVNKCGGVPLALKIIGSQLKAQGEDLGAWQFIENVEIWDLPELNEVFKVLKVSYLALPSHLKQCFSYCSIFRKGNSIQVDTLVQLWMAEGFIHVPKSSSNTNEKKVWEEDVGRQYVKSLLNCCFFEADERHKWEDRATSLKMHDLVHDLAKSVVSPIDQTSISVDSIEKGNPRRLQVVFTAEGASSAMQVLGDLMSMINIESLRVLILSKCFFGRLPIPNATSIMNLKRLRVLILKGVFIEELPDSIANLKHLRYLDISETMIRVLPECFTTLYNLQTLKLVYCGVTELPSDITRKLNNLRHLEVGGIYSAFDKMPKELGQLKFLQTLPRFKVSKESGYHISELGPLNHLRDELRIDHLENVEDKEAAKSAYLEKKLKVNELSLTWSTRSLNAGMESNDEDVLEGLQPPSNLRALKINNFMGSKFSTWLKMLPNLVEVELHRPKRCESLPAFGSLPHLRSLIIFEMDCVRRIGCEFYGDARPSFPSLKKLSLSIFPNLEEWAEAPVSTSSSSPSPSHSFPVLEELEVGGAVHLKSMPTLFPMLRKLDVSAVSSSILMLLATSRKLTCLTSLAISHMPGLTQLPPGILSDNKHLQRLEIFGCYVLETIPTEELQCLTSLKELKVGSFSYPFLPYKIRPIDSFSFLSAPDENKDQFLPGLKTLKLFDSKIASLPQYIEHLTTIETLTISGFSEIVALPDWLGNLLSLRELYLRECIRLEQLPSVEAMQRLTALKRLSAMGCKKLVPMCAKDGGREWHKISHIQRVSLS